MRHGNSLRKLSRSPEKRERLLRNLASHLFKHERIQTTLARGKELCRHADKLITLAKRGTPIAIKRLSSTVNGPSIISKLCKELAERYAERPGGYTRLWRAGLRPSDKIPLALVELVGCPFDLRATFSRFASSSSSSPLPTMSYPKPYEPSNKRSPLK